MGSWSMVMVAYFYRSIENMLQDLLDILLMLLSVQHDLKGREASRRVLRSAVSAEDESGSEH